MTRRVLILALCGLPAALAGQQAAVEPAVSEAPKIEVKGTIERVQVTPGQSMPFLELKSEKGMHRVLLGSMRYLMENNFNPKAGSQAIVTGFAVDNDVIMAQTVSIPAENLRLRLRDEKGQPLWRGGRYRGGRK